MDSPSRLNVREPLHWPEPPTTWSFSVLQQVEACPRRWALSAAPYAGVWKGRGYPPMPNSKALCGQVVHNCLGVLAKAFTNAQCSNTRDDGTAVGVLRSLGG